MARLEKPELLYQMNVLEEELRRATWFSAENPRMRISIEREGNEDHYDFSLFEQVFAAARAFLEGPHVGCLCPHCNPSQ